MLCLSVANCCIPVKSSQIIILMTDVGSQINLNCFVVVSVVEKKTYGHLLYCETEGNASHRS